MSDLNAFRRRFLRDSDIAWATTADTDKRQLMADAVTQLAELEVQAAVRDAEHQWLRRLYATAWEQARDLGGLRSWVWLAVRCCAITFDAFTWWLTPWEDEPDDECLLASCDELDDDEDSF